MKNDFGGAAIAGVRPESRLGEAGRGARGRIVGLAPSGGHGLAPDELERRLLEIGFVEGAPFEVLHIGLIGADPIAVRLGGTRIALRRREAKAVLVRLDP